ncbi:winged helix-turn-helix domain-containing protein [Halocatena marina]|uniref:ArsR family transcriptional regulator n=1 Tax=Halocatena marina TaxID=2934937 RepID=A0ABD5YHJ3_9EURY|nr:helix-turn-helix domain-containing protein [Halocatena marina]
MTESADYDDFADVSPEAAFALLGNKTRIDIIRELGEISDESLSFSALRSRVNIADSGQFNYHLKELLGSFVRRTDDGSYELTYAGSQVVGAIYSGTFNQRGASRAFKLISSCTKCGSSLEADYEQERVTIRCPACDDQKSSFGFPPGAFENRTHEELARAFDTWLQLLLLASFGGFCLNCAGRMHGSITDVSEYLDDKEIGTKHVCERCTNRTVNSVGAYLLYQPIVVAFHHDHGIDVTETPIWEIPWLRDEETTVLSREPWCVQSVVELDGDRLELVVEDDLSVTIVDT